MTTTKKFNKIIFSAFMLILALCLVVSGQQMLIKSPIKAVEMASNSVSITNSDFNSSTSIALQASPSGWSQLDSSSGKSGVITVKEKDFTSRASQYALESTKNPGKPYTSQVSPLDDHVLMINANSEASSNEYNNQGYESNSISLSAYSYYKLSIWTKTQDDAFASIYLSGLDDSANTKFERYEQTEWQEYRFYIATGIDTKSIRIELWLGSSTLGSYDAVFFDHITMKQLSENYFAEEANSSETVNVIDYREYLPSLVENADFETGTTKGWTVIDYLPVNADAKVYNINTSSSAPYEDFANIGSDLSENNTYAFGLYGSEKVAFGYKSTSFNVDPYQTYKISFKAKTSNLDGSAYAILKEGNDILNLYGLEEGNEDNFYTPVSATISISSNNTNELTNNYTTYSFYVKGHELYRTSFTIELWLGNSEESAKGAVVFDNFRFEQISHSQFSSASSTNSQSLSLTTISGTPSVANGTFNIVENLDKDFAYPLSPSEWTNTTSDSSKTSYGIINTNQTLFNEQQSNYGGILNPGKIDNTPLTQDYANNVLMLWNNSESYQSIKSPSFELTANKYLNISFDYKTIQQTANKQLMNVYLVDTDNNILFADYNLYSENWTNYSLLIKTSTSAISVSLVIELGDEDNLVKAYAFIDNVRFAENTEMTDEAYETYVQAHRTLDFAEGNFNIISSEQQYSMYTPYRYSRTLEEGINPSQGNPIAFGGIIDGSDNVFNVTNSPNNENALKYMPVIRVDGEATYALVAKDTILLQSASYYKFSIDIYSNFQSFTNNLDQENVDEDERAKFGAIFSLKGLDEASISEINTNGEWTTYTIYVKATTDCTVNLRFAIESESNDITGIAFFDNYKFETVEEQEFANAMNYEKTDNLLVIGSTDVEEPEEDTSTDDDDDSSDITTTIMYLIPSLILAVALILALIAYFMKKIKIKKWEKKKINEYDREHTLYRDVVRQEAEKQRQKNIDEVKQQIQEIEKEIERIEEINKQRL